MSSGQNHIRVTGSLTGPLERPVLQWLSARAPAWLSPDMLTVIGVLGAAVTCVSYGLTHLHAGFLWMASLGIAINWLGDSLDGTLARFRHIERPRYGFFVDHTADALSQVLILLGLGLTPFVEFWISCLVLIGYLLLSVVVYIRTILEGVFQITFGRIGPTEARIVLVLVNGGIFFFGNEEIRLLSITTTMVDALLASVAAVLFTVFCISVLRHARRLGKMSE